MTRHTQEYIAKYLKYTSVGQEKVKLILKNKRLEFVSSFDIINGNLRCFAYDFEYDDGDDGDNDEDYEADHQPVRIDLPCEIT